jgi:hypothetical protein
MMKEHLGGATVQVYFWDDLLLLQQQQQQVPVEIVDRDGIFG